MRLTLITLATLLLSACDYTVPLVTTPKNPIDENAIGLWQQIGDNNAGNRLVLLPLDRNEYLVGLPAQQEETMYARATLWQGEGMRLMQLNWIGTAQGITPDSNRTYQYARYKLDGDKLTVSLLNPAVVSKHITSSEKLSAAIGKMRDNPELFRKPMHFIRIIDGKD